jgi:glycosyltransferase involved in cell wall biosynthesis
MRIAFYAPLKSPTHGTPSGDRRVAGLLMQALADAGHRVELASTFRSYDGAGEAQRQAALREQGLSLGGRLAAQWRDGPAAARPDLWFTYHLYYKAPDWLGPGVATALGIPYVVAEASHAAKRDGGPWEIGQQGAARAIGLAELLLCPTRDDMEGVATLAAAERIVHLPPFLDAEPFAAAARERAAHRRQWAAECGADPGVPWIAVAAMLRPGDKLASYRVLADTLARVQEPWQLLVAGDGTARAEVVAALEAVGPGRVRMLGALSPPEVAALYAACDLYVWPAVNEAYGMAMLEAQAAGLPVVSCRTRGVPDEVEHGRTGLLAPAGDAEALAALVRRLLQAPQERARLAAGAAAFACGERSLAQASARLGSLLQRFATRAGASA